MSFKDIKYFQKYVSTSISKYNSNPQAFLESDIRSIFSRLTYARKGPRPLSRSSPAA